MHAYGYDRRSKKECDYGCCDNANAGKKRCARKANDRASRKAGRRVDRKLFTSLLASEE